MEVVLFSVRSLALVLSFSARSRPRDASMAKVCCRGARRLREKGPLTRACSSFQLHSFARSMQRKKNSRNAKTQNLFFFFQKKTPPPPPTSTTVAQEAHEAPEAQAPSPALEVDYLSGGSAKGEAA